MSNLATLVQAQLIKNKKSIEFDARQLSTIVSGLPSAPRWIIQAMYDLDGAQKRTLQEAATYLGDSSPESAQESYKTAINTIAKRFWDKSKPKKGAKPAETIPPESLREGIYLNDRLVDDTTLAKLNKPIKPTDMSVRSFNALKGIKVEDIGSLVQCREAHLLKTKKFGRKSLREIKEILADEGFELGMKLEGWSPQLRDNTPISSDKHW